MMNLINYMKNSKIQKKGVTMMILIITIILILILASAILITLSFTDPVGEANEARFKTDIQAMKDSYRILYNDLLYKNLGDENKIKDTDFKDIVPDEYKDEFVASKDGIEYIGDDEDKKIIADEMGLGKKNNKLLEDIAVIADITSIDVEVITKEDTGIDEYIYYIRESGKDDWTEYTDPGNKKKIEGLKEDTEYEIMVEIVKSNGEEEEREESDIKVVRTKKLESGKLILKLNDKNGSSYIEGTWTKENVYVEVEGAKTTYRVTGANEVETTSEPVVLRNQGESKVILETRDGASVIRKEYTVKIDKEEPDGKMQKEIRLKTEETANVTVSAVEVTDNLSGVKEYEYYLDGKLKITTKENKYTYENLALGKYELKIVISDNAGNKRELIRTVEIGMPDVNDPSKVDIEKTPTTWTNGNVKVKITFTAEDEYTPQYSEDKIRWTDVPKICEKEIEENKSVYIRFVYHGEEDIIGNQREIVIDNIDKVNPVINSLTSGNETITNKDVKLTGKAIDTLSGLIGYQFSKDGSLTATSGGWETIPNTKEEITKEYAATENGTYYFYVKDEAQNVTKKEIVIENIDKTAPTLESLNVVSPISGMYMAEEIVTIVATYSENVYGVSPQLKIRFGTGTDREALAGEIVDNRIIYTYVIASGDNGKIESRGYTGTVKDSADNELVLTNAELGGNDVSADTIPPTNDAPTLASNTNSITATLQQTDTVGINNATIQYAIKAETDSAWGGWVEGSLDTHTFSDLIMNTSYQVKTRVSDVVGNTSESEVATISTVNITKPTISAPTEWTNENVTVTITYPDIEGTTKQYSTNGTSWTDTTLTTQTVSVGTNNTTVYARLIDNTDQTGGNATHTVTNIDRKAPNNFTPTASGAGDIDVNSIKVTATTSDVEDATNGASGIKNYQFSKDNGATWTPVQTENTYTFSGLTSNTTYNMVVKVTDNAGNPVTSTAAPIKTLVAIAKIGTTEYSSIQNAFNAAPNSTAATVTLLQSTTESPTLAEAKNVTFNMDSKTITGTVASNGTIAMQSGTVDGTITLQGNKTDTLTNVSSKRLNIGSQATAGQTKVTVTGGTFKKTETNENGNIIVTWGNLTLDGNVTVSNVVGNAAIYNEPGATLTIKNGTYSSPYATVKNLGTANIQGGTYTGTGSSSSSGTYALLANDGTGGSNPSMTISGGTVTATNLYAVGNINGNNVTISGGTFSSNVNCVMNDGTSMSITSNNVSITSPQYAVINSSGTLNISAGKIKSTATTGYAAVANVATTNITGVTIESSAMGIWNRTGGTLTISGGTVTSTGNYTAVLNEGTKFTMSGSTQVIGKSATVIENDAGTMEIKGGTARCDATNYYTLVNQNNAILKLSAGTINAASGAIIYNTATHTNSMLVAATISGGTLNGRVENDGTMTMSGGTVTGQFTNGGGTAYLTGTVNITSASNTVFVSAGTVYINGTSTRITSTSTSGNGAIYNRGTGVIDISAGIITAPSCFVLINAGTKVTVSGSASLTSGSPGQAVVNNSTMVISGGTISYTGSGSSGAGVWNDGTLTMSGGTVKSTRYGIVVGGTFTRKGGTITPGSGYAAVLNNGGTIN